MSYVGGVFSDNDVLLFTEYMIKGEFDQDIINRIYSKSFPGKKFGIAHLVPRDVERSFSDEDIRDWVSRLDGLITLGSSLTEFYKSKGISADKLHTTFHYLDDYYHCRPVRSDRPIKILVQGNMCRDLDTLDYIVANCPDINFVICQGFNDFSARYPQPNVELKSFIPESELRELMKECCISLNCMIDTIGSNVIVTSLGMGMAMVCSDVGSIRDYCDESNSVLCKSKEDFVQSIRRLVNDKDKIYRMQMSSYEKSETIRLDKFADHIRYIVK